MRPNVWKHFREFYQGFEGKGSEKKQNLLHSRRHFFLIGLVFVGILFLDLFLWQMNRSLNRPFAKMMERTAVLYPTTEKPSQEELLLTLQNTDTDQDGLSDYDEIYVWNTSAYLPDSDSDGIFDSEEIARGSDPNCSQGKDCSSGPPDPETASLPPVSNFERDAAAALRYALEKTGIPKEQIDAFSDEELLQIYQEAVSGAPIGVGAEGTVNPEDLLAFEQLSPKEIRDLLIAAGVDENLIKTIPDEKIKEIYLETLETVKKTPTNQNTSLPLNEYEPE